MPVPEPPKKHMTKIRWIKAINTHKVGQIEDVSSARIKNLTEAGLVELYPPKPAPVPKPAVETADARPALSAKAHKRKVHAK